MCGRRRGRSIWYGPSNISICRDENRRLGSAPRLVWPRHAPPRRPARRHRVRVQQERSHAAGALHPPRLPARVARHRVLFGRRDGAAHAVRRGGHGARGDRVGEAQRRGDGALLGGGGEREGLVGAELQQQRGRAADAAACAGAGPEGVRAAACGADGPSARPGLERLGSAYTGPSWPRGRRRAGWGRASPARWPARRAPRWRAPPPAAAAATRRRASRATARQRGAPTPPARRTCPARGRGGVSSRRRPPSAWRRALRRRL